MGAAAGTLVALATAGLGLLIAPQIDPFTFKPTDAFHYYNETQPLADDPRLVYAIGVLGIPVGAFLGLTFGPFAARHGGVAIFYIAAAAAVLALPLGGFVFGLVEDWGETSVLFTALLCAVFGPFFWFNPSIVITIACSFVASGAVRLVFMRRS